MTAYPLSLKVFKHYWAEMAPQYPVTNNDAALMFRAITELVLLPYISCHIAAQTAPIELWSDRIEQVARCFPIDLAPLCRGLTKACIETLRSDQSAVA